MRRRFFIFKSFSTKVIVILVLSMLISGAISEFLIYKYTLDSQFSEMRRELMSLAQVVTLAIDTNAVLDIPLNKDGIYSENYRNLVNKLLLMGNAVPSLAYIYIMKPTDKPGIYKFIVDVKLGLYKGNIPPAYPGDTYDGRRFPALIEAVRRPSADKEITTDEWGVFLSGYAPIKNRSGDTIAILGADMSAINLRSIQLEVKKRAIYILLFGIAISIIIGMLIAGRISRPILKLVDGTRRIATGDLDHRVDVKGSDEISELARSLNIMSGELKEYMTKLKKTIAEKERFLKELEIARSIQQGVLPESAPKVDGVDIAAISTPAEEVGGDFYDFIPMDNGRWGIVVADVSGRGIPAALFVALSRTLIRAYATGRTALSDALNHANLLIFKEARGKIFVTLFYGILDMKNRSFEYINAGHNPPVLLRRASGDRFFLKAQGMPLGLLESNEMQPDKIELGPGDILAMYTDGVIESVNRGKEQFGMDRMVNSIIDNRDQSAGRIIEQVQKRLHAFVDGQAQFDDITMLIIKSR